MSVTDVFAQSSKFEAATDHIDLRELAGLHYYNQAVSFYNKQQVELALINLEYAFKLYPSLRLQEFKRLIEINASNK